MTNAQMRFGAGDVLDPNAVVQIDTADGTRKGLLMPRLRLFSTNSFAPLGAHVAGMIVYNTSTSGADPFKEYYRNKKSIKYGSMHQMDRLRLP